ncbi:hypothetical protein GF325_10325 [Candidatus Bathyarchaeota archaeon]|nr:hypothetical protein [Candidatus Bathyarchaeota archaeon]
MSQGTINEEELKALSKEQLISFIVKNFKKCNEGEPKVGVMEPPGGLACIKLPSPRVNINPLDYKPLNLKVAPPPPVPRRSDEAVRKKNILPPEELEGTRKIFVKCERCDRTFIIDIPRRLVLANPLEVVPVTIMHDEEHALTVYLDQNFESRRDYISEIYVLDEFKDRYKQLINS